MRFAFVFGAGASAAEGAPTIANFLSESYRLYGNNAEFTLIWNFIKESFSKPITGYQDMQDNFPSIDEIFSLIDYCLISNTSLTRQHSIDSIHKIKRQLISLMTRTLREMAKSYDTHLVFLERHLNAFKGCDIISLNYDTLLDKALTSIVKDKVNYGFSSENSFAQVKGKYRLYKLHGSLNWGNCTFCKNITIFDRDVAHELGSNYPCKECSHHNLEPVIITPTLLKDYNYAKLQNVWDSAFKVISKCDVLVFIGYSLNFADVSIIHLIKRAISAGGNKLKKIVVIDKDTSDNPCPPTLSRYIKIFNKEIKYIRDGFQKDLDLMKIIEQ
ncbi:SIR2 family protein [Desulfotomaculum nigrificans]|uniref:SIR2 family protein n=1 Tax=Desulfotomaculum nigrificans TaxID=1565 RepID=UPI0001FAEB1B|nr:SIR2 family protein [Desulfotomaculum nigrificans]